LVRQTLRGYGRVNRFTDAEERALATRLTPEAARARFIELCQAWEQGGARAGGDLKAVEHLRIAETVRAQRPFVEIVRRMRRR